VKYSLWLLAELAVIAADIPEGGLSFKPYTLLFNHLSLHLLLLSVFDKWKIYIYIYRRNEFIIPILSKVNKFEFKNSLEFWKNINFFKIFFKILISSLVDESDSEE
jgi:hypothetical protein